MTKKLYVNAKQKQFLLNQKPLNLFLGGRGVGKTHVLGFAKYQQIRAFPKGTTFLAAATYGQLLTKTIPELKAVWSTFGLIQDLHYVVGIKCPIILILTLLYLTIIHYQI